MNSDPKKSRWVSHKLDAKVERALGKLALARDVVHVAVMPDVHLAGDVCNGVVLATEDLIYPQCIGGDIGCGYLLVELGVRDSDSLECESVLSAFWNGIRRSVPINKHHGRECFDAPFELSSSFLEKSAQREGRLQLGTLGRGNHFVELQRDEQGDYFLLIHSGSRSMGQAISASHLRGAEVDPVSGLKFLRAESNSGMAFLSDLKWARQYAHANRLEMLRAIERSVFSELGIVALSEIAIHLDHNHVQQELHFERQLWVHRKGAQVLLDGEVSVIPGSMGTPTYFVEGKQNPDALNSCSHGAGRSMSRKEAASQLSTKKLRREIGGVWYGHGRVEKLLDEAPSAYKDIRKVMKAQKELVRIVGKSCPVLSFKGR